MRSRRVKSIVLLPLSFLGILAAGGAPAQASASSDADAPYQYVYNHESRKCLDVIGESVEAGAGLVLAPCSAERRSQMWRKDEGHRDFFVLINRKSRLCASPREEGPRLVQLDCASQRHFRHWRLDKVNERWSQLVNERTNLCMDVRGTEGAENPRVVQRTCEREKRSQHWRLRDEVSGPRPEPVRGAPSPF
ncbi:RICIN domain-containing protein [Kutzneria albida]|uniref:Ricin B lectin domain-containing protein n=1 Tax=Kutzneria albida DSM 43870 TaxID=1449976 RepID=W5WGF9_9PSEU|nr:RICIN domain-containing protein [Kutzneria albida]AHH99840.1 hypothetical protein KALB_6481 [Kutzneria albida DSM 43870]